MAANTRDWFEHWYSNEEAFPWYFRYRSDQPDKYFGQTIFTDREMLSWFAPTLRFFYRYPIWYMALQSAVGLLGLAALATDPQYRVCAMWCMAILLYFATVTAIVIFPLFRFRVPVLVLLESGQALLASAIVRFVSNRVGS